MWDQIVEPDRATEAIAEAHGVGRDRGEGAATSVHVRLGPCRQPAVHERRRIGVLHVGDGVGEQRQLKAPALDELGAKRRVGKRMRQMQSRAGVDRLERDGDERSTRRNRPAP